MKSFGAFVVICVFMVLIAETESVQRVFVDAMDQIIGKATKTASTNVVNKAVASSGKTVGQKGAGITDGMKRMVKNLQKKASGMFGKPAKDEAKKLSKAPFPSSMGKKEVKKLEKSILKMDKQLKNIQKQLHKTQI
uniref:Hypothetical secreted protein n=1 Tax=Simulium vittatum TaxID=7192 RepID=B5M0W8_SIMVI|nr:hypothetical secreted protein [Simulium vittatum]